MAEENSARGFGWSVAAQLAAQALIAAAPVIWLFLGTGLKTTVALPLAVYIAVMLGVLLLSTVGMLVITRSLRRKLETWMESQSEAERLLQEQNNAYGEQLGHWARAEKEFKSRIEELEGELAERDSVVYADGLYYRAKDTERRQPFCRICWESGQKLTTIIDRTTLDNGYRYYQCPVCMEQHQLPSIPVGDPDAYEPLEEDGYRPDPRF